MKTDSRIPSHYKKGTKDWEAEHNMLLEDGETCADCFHCERCCTIFGQSSTDDKCQFHPNRFYPRNDQCHTAETASSEKSNESRGEKSASSTTGRPASST